MASSSKVSKKRKQTLAKEEPKPKRPKPTPKAGARGARGVWGAQPPTRAREDQDPDVMIIGIDEAGRGTFAGPVVAAAVHIPRDVDIPGIKDSKKVTPKAREAIFEALTSNKRVRYGIGIVDSKAIDKINILQATMRAMTMAWKGVEQKLGSDTQSFVLVDGNKMPSEIQNGEAVIKGDNKHYMIAAASILAKVTRDRMMVEYAKEFPMYGFDKHKGYGSAAHKKALEEHGPCDIHRKTFKPIAKLLE